MKARNIEGEGFGKQVPPKREFVSIYFAQKGLPESEAERFFSYYDNIGWKNANGNSVHNWKTLACDWIWEKKFAFNGMRN